MATSSRCKAAGVAQLPHKPGGHRHCGVELRRCGCVLAGCLCLIASAAPPAAFAFTGVFEDTLAPPARAGHDGVAFFSSLRYFAGNDWTAMNGIEGNWSGRFSPRSGRNLAVAFLRAEVGVARDSWRISYLHRREAIVDASRDAIDLLYLEKNNLPIPVGRRFALRFDAEVLEAEGLKIEKAFELYRGDHSGLRASLGASLLRGSRTRSSTVRGELTATGPNTFSFDANWIDSYTKKTFLFITPGSPEGSGYALDAALEFKWADRNRLSLSVADLDARIAWRDVPTTEARATSNTATRDAQGFIVYQPAVVGQNRRKDYTQHLDPKTTIQYSRAFGPLSLGAGALVIRSIVIPRVSFDYRLDDAWRFALEHDFRFGSVGLGLRYKLLSIAVLSERRNLDSAKSLGLAAQLVVPF